MTRFGTAAFALATATLLVGPFAPVARSAPTASLVTLKNGLRVVLAPDSSATAVDLGVWYAVGIGEELPAAAGARRLIERLMSRGSAHVPDGEHQKRLTAEGATVGTTLQLDYSCFYETLPAEELGTALRLEADRMAGLATAPAAFEEVRRATLADVKGRDARPVVPRALALLGGSVYAGLPYAGPVEGDEASLARATASSIEAWRKQHYGASNAVLTLVGRFEPQATLALVQSLFGSLPRGKAIATRARAGAVAETGERRLWKQGANVPARLLLVGWRMPGMRDADAAAIEMLAAMLSAGDAPRFTQAMTRTWATTSFAQSGLDRHMDASMLWTLSALRAEADSAATERQVIDVVGALARDPLPGSDLDRIRGQLITAELLRTQQCRARAQSLGDALILSGDPSGPEKRIAALERLTPADLQRVAARVLTENARSVVWLVPEGGAK